MLKRFTMLAVLALTILFGGEIASASQTNVYIAAAAAGANTGADCNDAHALSFFNTSANWGAGSSQIGPGTTVYLCTGNYGVGATNLNLLTFQGSGTSGNVITLAFMSGAEIEPYYCTTGSSGCIASDGQSYITIDGQGVGIIQNQLNGSPGGTCPSGTCMYQQDTHAVDCSGSNHCTIKNLTIADMYDRTSMTDEAGTGAGIDAQNGANNFVMINNTIHDVQSGLFWVYQGTNQAITVANNTIYNISGGIVIADGGGSDTLTSALLYGNYIHDFAKWSDQASGYNYHHDGFHIWAVHSSCTISGLYLYNNTFGGDFGAGTAQVYFEIDGSSNTATGYFFNNQFIPTGDTGDSSGGGAGFWIQTGGGSGNTVNAYEYNNTFSGAQVLAANWMEGGGGPINLVAKNNIFSQFGLLFTNQDASGMLANETLNYNTWYCSVTGCTQGNGLWDDNGGGYNTLAAWQSYSHQDANSVQANPLLNSNLTLQSGSPARGLGTDLYSVCNGQPNPGLGALCYDGAGIARPSSGNWDAGVFNYVQSSQGPPPVILISSLPSGTAGEPYSTTLTDICSNTPCTWSGSGFPLGLMLSAAGVLSGTPIASGSFSITLILTDSDDLQTTESLTLTIAPLAAPTTLKITSNT